MTKTNIINLHKQPDTNLEGYPDKKIIVTETYQEFKTNLDDTLDLAERVQDYRDKLPMADRKDFEALTQIIWNELESISLMLEDKNLIYKRDKKLSKKPEAKTTEDRYQKTRLKELSTLNHDALLKRVVDLELELLDYAERLLSDAPIPMDEMTAYGTLELLGDDAIKTLTDVDKDKDYQSLHHAL